MDIRYVTPDMADMDLYDREYKECVAREVASGDMVYASLTEGTQMDRLSFSEVKFWLEMARRAAIAIREKEHADVVLFAIVQDKFGREDSAAQYALRPMTIGDYKRFLEILKPGERLYAVFSPMAYRTLSEYCGITEADGSAWYIKPAPGM